VTGTSFGRGGASGDYATVAYSAATGRRLWVGRYNGPGNGFDGASALAVSPAGTRVFVTGQSQGRGTGSLADDYATVAYSAATGRQLWVSRYTGPPRKSRDNGASALAVSPGGSRVFVTGYSFGRVTRFDYATVAYSAATGRQLWVSRYNGAGNGFDAAASVAVSPGGSRVFVTGYSAGGTGSGDYATVAYSAAAGKQQWVSRYNGPASLYDAACCVAVSPAGTAVFVTGYGYDMTTKLRLRHRCLPRLRPPVLPGQRIARAARPRVADRPIPAGPGERTVRSVRADQGQA